MQTIVQSIIDSVNTEPTVKEQKQKKLEIKYTHIETEKELYVKENSDKSNNSAR